MAIFKMTYNEGTDSVILVNHGCNYSCSICSYRLREGMEPNRFFQPSEVEGYLMEADPSMVMIIGGEPTTWCDLYRIARFCKDELGAYVKIPHSNLSNLPPMEVDEVGVSLFALSKRKYTQLTGGQNSRVLSNIYKVYDRGTRLSVSTILIPDFIGTEEVVSIARFLAGIDEGIPLHVISYLPVPGMSWRRPSREEMDRTVEACRDVLRNVTGTYMTAGLAARMDDVYLAQDVRVA
jgi:pyruvate formate lyase activating enzyme